MSRLDAFTWAIEKASRFGEKQVGGARLIGTAPFVGPDAWIHLVYPPLGHAQIDKLEDELTVRIPDPYRELLGIMNGCSLFLDSLSLDGHRTSHSRAADAVPEPYDILTVNRDERVHCAGSELFFIGGYSFDGSLLFLAPTGEVCRCSRDDVYPHNTWPDIWSMLNNEALRLLSLFEVHEYRIPSLLSTTPASDHSVQNKRGGEPRLDQDAP